MFDRDSARSRITHAWPLILVGIFLTVAPRHRVVAADRDLAGSMGGRNLEGSVRHALENNPQLRAIRRQRGLAAAGVVLARVYPYNPVYQGTFLHATGAEPGDVASSFSQAHQLTQQIQLFHQQRHRRRAAEAALSRVEWEVAAQELAFAVGAIRAFDGLVYRRAKLAVTEEFLQLNRGGVRQVEQLVEQGTLTAADLILARAEVRDLEAQIGLNRSAVVVATRDYCRALGLAGGPPVPEGTLDRPAPEGGVEKWLESAREGRPDRRARVAGVAEARANLGFQRADRFGDPQIGPVYELSESLTRFAGAKVQMSLPIFNRKQGEIAQARAQLELVEQLVQQAEIEIGQDVRLATARLEEAHRWAETYRDDVVPALREGLESMELLLEQGQPGVDMLRVLDVRRKLLRARDGHLDALLAYTSALADLAQAVGDPHLAMNPVAGKSSHQGEDCSSPEETEENE